MTRISLPYINNVSEATARLLAPYNVRVAHKPDQTLRSKIMRPKDPLPTADRSAVVYRINCMDCQSNYVGETSKRLRTRLQEHKLAIKRGEQYSQIWSHMAENGHRFDFDHTQIVASDATKGGRLLKEAWFSGKNSVNRHIDMCPAQRTLRTWHTNRWRRSGHRPHDQEEDSVPSVPHDRMDTALTSDWCGTALKDSPQPPDDRHKLEQRQEINPLGGAMNKDTGKVGPHRGKAYDPPSDPARERKIVEQTAAGTLEITARKGGEVDDRTWERTSRLRLHAPDPLDRPRTSRANACIWPAGPSRRGGEREPVPSEPACEGGDTSVADLTTPGEDGPVSEQKGRGGWSDVGSGEMQPETAVARDVWEGNIQCDGAIRLRSRRMGGGLDRSPAGIVKVVEKERRGGVTRMPPNKQERNYEQGGEAGIVADEPAKGNSTSPRANNKEVRDGTQRGRKQAPHPEVRRTRTHILGAQHAQLGPVTRSRSRAQKIDSHI